MVSAQVWKVFTGGDEPTLEGGSGKREEKLNQRLDGSQERITNTKYKINYKYLFLKIQIQLIRQTT